ncbi:MAG: ferrous iron transport protein B [Bacteroidetes bacterium]|nr:ferrous iron transport protein B [Bacteroidota bacterium]
MIDETIEKPPVNPVKSDKVGAEQFHNVNTFRIALTGNPNSGKSCLFNALTGLHQHTGNYPGVTIDKKTGWFSLPGKNIRAEIIDLPGIYGLTPGSEDETITYKILTGLEKGVQLNLAVVVIDASKLKRSLFLCSELIDRGIPVVIALNMVDVAENKGISVDPEKLSAELRVPVIPVNAKKQAGIQNLVQAVSAAYRAAPVTFPKPVADNSPGNAGRTIQRYRKISEIVEACVKISPRSDRIVPIVLDYLVTHKFWGYFLFLTVLFLIFQAIFSWSSYPMDLIDSSFIKLRIFLRQILPAGLITDLFTDGIIPGIGGILMFIPQIAFLFFFIAILEDTGYLARVSFIMDKLMRKIGLNGRSVIPLISGAACAIPAIMSTRTIKNRKERLVTAFVIPLISCSARIPVYILLVSLIIPSEEKIWIFNMQGIVLMAFYLLGVIAVTVTAGFLRLMVSSKEPSYFIMELPEFQVPQWKTVGLTILDKVKVFTVEAGQIILAISIILWVLASYGPGDSMEKIEKRYAGKEFIGHLNEREASVMKQSEKLSASWAGVLGRKLEPVIEPLGFDWKIGIAIITSFAAREVFVGTMATIYSVGDISNQTLRNRMAMEINPGTGKKQYGLPVCLSLMVFYAFALQCMSTIAVMYRETRHWKWPLLQLCFLTGIAYLLSFITYQILS